MALSIKTYLPDLLQDGSDFCKVLTKVVLDMVRFRKYPIQTSQPNLDLYFLLPGKGEEPEFEGMRLHSFDMCSNTLKIECAVPGGLAKSLHAKHYVVSVIEDAVNAANEYFEMRDVAFRRDEYLRMVNTFGLSREVSVH